MKKYDYGGYWQDGRKRFPDLDQKFFGQYDAPFLCFESLDPYFTVISIRHNVMISFSVLEKLYELFSSYLHSAKAFQIHVYTIHKFKPIVEKCIPKRKKTFIFCQFQMINLHVNKKHARGLLSVSDGLIS